MVTKDGEEIGIPRNAPTTKELLDMFGRLPYKGKLTYQECYDTAIDGADQYSVRLALIKRWSAVRST